MHYFSIKNPFILIIKLLLLIELLSFLAYFYPILQPFILISLFVITLLISLRSLEYGLLLSVAELIIGSKGHLFSYTLFSFPLSLRLVLFIALMIASLIYIYRQDWRLLYKKILNYPLWRPFLVLLGFIAFGLIVALIRGNSVIDIFQDINAWFYLAWILPLSLIYLPKITNEQKARLYLIAGAALTWLALKGLFLLFIFSHNLVIVPDLYLWLRRSGVAEITAMGGGWYRIFIQSQIYLAPAFIMGLWYYLSHNLNKQQKVKVYLFLVLMMTNLIMSMSRSFWLAFVLAMAVGVIFTWRNKWRFYFLNAMHVLVITLLSLFLIFIIIKFPYPNQSSSVSMSALSERLEVESGEAALASRWSLLPALWSEINNSFFFGQGFGANVSYVSQDPRVLAQNPDGLYTSYAFEWAYLDTWLKIGFFGLLAFLVWLLLILHGLIKSSRKENKIEITALAIALFFLMIVNIFTPYLNHPLGLSFLLLSSCFITKNSL